jgi:hypothetical protein
MAYPKLEVIRRRNDRGIFPFGVSVFVGGASCFHMPKSARFTCKR